MKETLFKKEIYQQPDVIRKLCVSNQQVIAELIMQLNKYPPDNIVIAARGTSDNAAVYAKYLLSAYVRIPVGLAIPSLFTLYHLPPDLSSSLVIGISQSGYATDVLAVIEEANQQGAVTLSISNDADSPLATASDYSILIGAGKEKSVAASKTYIGQLTAVASLAASWKADQQMLEELNCLGDLVAEALMQHEAATQIAEQLREKEHLVVLGRGFTFCTAHEIALKIKELTYMVTEAYSAADFRHGPVAMLEAGFPVIAIAPQDSAIDDMRSLVDEIQHITKEIIVISNDDDLLSKGAYSLKLPSNLPSWLAPIVSTIPGQLLGLELAIEKGLDVDRPRGLKKVTQTL